jgi:hypothetical protein
VVRPFVLRPRLEYIRLLDFGLDGIVKGPLPQIGHRNSKGGRVGKPKP